MTAGLSTKGLPVTTTFAYQCRCGCVPMPLRVVDGPSSGRLISLDPGVRTFLTGYSPDGEAIELGKSNIGHIYRRCHSLDELHRK
ncbi:hypothetical protein V1517DRAFT_312599 [Lipomyces orientalis]|uniref:Uncharacterized protein n=1 Tax=Lipomyces orientalis TaxID=1233043 RepID=A0ACC3TXY3_9ASCO